MNKMKANVLALSLAGLATATPVLAADTQAVAVEPIAIPAPPAGKGQIVFFRPSGMGFAIGCSVNENGQKISSLGAGKYFVMVAEPGKHEYMVHSEAKDVLALEVEADETQYASCKIKMGIMVGRPDIRPATQAEFLAAKKLKPVDDEDMGPAAGALRATELAAALNGTATPAVAAPAVVPAVASPAETPVSTPAAVTN